MEEMTTEATPDDSGQVASGAGVGTPEASQFDRMQFDPASLPENLRNEPSLQTFSTVDNLAKSYVNAVKKIVESGILSQYLGEWDADFYGGPQVREFEERWSDYFKIKNSIAVNSCTSGLIIALGAIDLQPGDEVIVSPWTMSASATAILVWNAIPVFADIEDETFNLDPVSIEKNITPYTKAIVVTNIFGHPASLYEIMAIAKKYKLKVIEDNAQAPGALYHDKYTGCVSDIGVFSLNYHKHIHTGEGGMCVTNNDELAERMLLIRNHAEAVSNGCRSCQEPLRYSVQSSP